jgi:mRNA-degrading endonuclease RelE of RelBE toxin-antitoxin system
MRSLFFPTAALSRQKVEKGKRKLQHLLYGKKPDVYRVIYEVDEGRQTMLVLHSATTQGGR